MKDVSIRQRLVTAFVAFEIVCVLSNAVGYMAASKTLTAEDPARFLQQYGRFTAIVGIVMIILMTIVIRQVVRSIRLPIEELVEASKKMADGDDDISFTWAKNGEFGVLSQAFTDMVQGNREQSNMVGMVADGDLTVDVKPKSDKDVLGNSIKRMVSTNRESLSHIDDAANSVMVSASEVASASEALAQGSTEQASAIEEITASIDDVAHKTKDNAKEAQNAEELMKKTLEDMELGNKRMGEMVEAMNDINVSSESISKIIKVIDDISFQTNILALNAAVEAARAGDAGMGFAVVAEEVRNLAAKSSQAAAETAELIEDSIKKVQSGSVIADETAKALDEISKMVSQSETIVHGIADSSEYQATAIDQIDQAVGQISVVVQTNSATSEECAAASSELSNQANRMRSLLSQYKLGNASTNVYGNSRKNPTAERNEQIISLGSGFGKY